MGRPFAVTVPVTETGLDELMARAVMSVVMMMVLLQS
jgi:hypothetical protein